MRSRSAQRTSSRRSRPWSTRLAGRFQDRGRGEDRSRDRHKGGGLRGSQGSAGRPCCRLDSDRKHAGSELLRRIEPTSLRSSPRSRAGRVSPSSGSPATRFARRERFRVLPGAPAFARVRFHRELRLAAIEPAVAPKERRRAGRATFPDALAVSTYRAGSNSSIGFPSGSSSWICLPTGPTSISFLNRNPACFSNSMYAGRSATRTTIRFHPPGA